MWTSILLTNDKGLWLFILGVFYKYNRFLTKLGQGSSLYGGRRYKSSIFSFNKYIFIVH